MWLHGITLLALVASCNKGPSCETRKKQASESIRTARLLANDTTREQTEFDAAASKLEQLRAFQVKLIASISQVRSMHGCNPKLICCAKAATWIADSAAAPEGSRPLWRLPPFGDTTGAPAELVKHIASYDEAATKLADLLAKPDASLDEVTAACTQADAAIDLVRSMSPNVVSTAVDSAEADRDARAETLKTANGRAAPFLAWEDAISRGVKFEVPPPSPSEPVPFTEARAKAKAVQSCLK